MSPQRLALAWTVALALTVLTGCASWLAEKSSATDETKRATALVWAHYGMPHPAPYVIVRDPRDIREADRCTSSAGTPGFKSVFSNACLAGITMPSGEGCYMKIVMWTDRPISDTALAHELLHCARLKAGAPLPHHTENGWTAPPEREAKFFQEVEAANEMLRASGL